MSTTDSPSSSPLVITRQLKAPRQRVWDVYTQAAHLPHWFGPQSVSMTHCAMDFRVGGRFHYCQRMDNGTEVWGLWRFREIHAPHTLVLMQHFSDAQGSVARNPWSASWPLNTLSTTTLAEQDGGTLLTIRWEAHEANAEEHATFLAGHASMTPGWNSVIDRLESYLALLQAA
jgi:uncharacterized protein YndB with AHSA1/START domain